MEQIPSVQGLRFSKHARKRMQQRCFNEKEIRYVIEHGTKIWRAGALHIVLRWKDIPGQDRKIEWKRRLEGTTVLIPSRQYPPYVQTVYRNRYATRAVRRKEKTNLRKYKRVSSQQLQM